MIPVERHCPACGAAFTRARWLRAKYCSRACASRSTFLSHGKRATPEYAIWSNIIRRCENPRHKYYDRYGGRGIAMCPRWRESFDAFYADMGPRPDGHQIDRVDNDGPYSPENCRWATPTEQQRNRGNNRRIDALGLRLTLAEWEERTGLRKATISKRLESGWTADDAVSRPSRTRLPPRSEVK